MLCVVLKMLWLMICSLFYRCVHGRPQKILQVAGCNIDISLILFQVANDAV